MSRHWNDVGMTVDHVHYRQNKAGRWYHLDGKLGWCPVLSKKKAAELDELYEKETGS